MRFIQRRRDILVRDQTMLTIGHSIGNKCMEQISPTLMS